MRVYKFITILMMVLLAQGRVTHDAEDEKAFSNRVKKYLTRKCSKNATLDELNKSLESLSKAKTCFKKKFPKHTSEDDEKLKVKCLEAVEEITECIAILLNALKPCLDKEEQYLPSYVAKAYEGYADYFCEHSDMLTMPNMFDSGLVQCINRFKKYRETNPQYVCYDFTKFSHHNDSTPITKKEFCSDLDNLYNCYESHYKQYCKDSPKAWEFEGGLINGLRKPCKEK